MKLLLDTHTLLWWLSGDPTLADAATAAIADASNLVLVSVATAWEMAIKRSLGKLHFPDALATALDDEGFQVLPISLGHALRAGALPRHHDDPFDRMLIAQALLDDLTVVTRDEQFSRYGVTVLTA